MYKWSRYGGYECNSQGDKRFSAMFAVMPDGRTIEQHYQCDIKGYQPGGTNWKLGKGKPPKSTFPGDTLWLAYLDLWRVWAGNYSTEMQELRNRAGQHSMILSDRFASTPINQARALATLLNDGFGL